jgi:hypothetical protein
MSATQAVPRGGIGYLFAGQSCCREQTISAHGRLERVLQTGIRSLPLARLVSQTWFAPNRLGQVTVASRRFRGFGSPRGPVRMDVDGNRVLSAEPNRQTPCPCPAGGPFRY